MHCFGKPCFCLSMMYTLQASARTSDREGGGGEFDVPPYHPCCMGMTLLHLLSLHTCNEYPDQVNFIMGWTDFHLLTHVNAKISGIIKFRGREDPPGGWGGRGHTDIWWSAELVASASTRHALRMLLDSHGMHQDAVKGRDRHWRRGGGGGVAVWAHHEHLSMSFAALKTLRIYQQLQACIGRFVPSGVVVVVGGGGGGIESNVRASASH